MNTGKIPYFPELSSSRVRLRPGAPKTILADTHAEYLLEYRKSIKATCKVLWSRLPDDIQDYLCTFLGYTCDEFARSRFPSYTTIVRSIADGKFKADADGWVVGSIKEGLIITYAITENSGETCGVLPFDALNDPFKAAGRCMRCVPRDVHGEDRLRIGRALGSKLYKALRLSILVLDELID